jgi:hypothetical protein
MLTTSTAASTSKYLFSKEQKEKEKKQKKRSHGVLFTLVSSE